MNYLDINKSIMISSPAGSGKTEKLARRYIALLQNGVDVERILAMTFTDKAAAEMKQRILRILKDEDEGLFKQLLEKMPLMRVTTIHSFCGTLLRRFSFEAAIDPNYRISDAIDSGMAWEEIIYEVLMGAGRGEEGHEVLIQTLGEKGFRGLDYLKNIADYLFKKTPFSLEAASFIPSAADTSLLSEELRSWPGVRDVIERYDEFFEKGPSGEWEYFEKFFLTDKKEPRKRPLPLMKHISGHQEWSLRMYEYWKAAKIREHAKRTERLRGIFRKCLDKYTEWKKAKAALDFSDLEYLSYKMLTENPEWANILYAFDEKTDHILVDEFQDTNSFQWEIINKLTEEWRSGLGAKREEGTRPTSFFVGDEKQSIYFFRGANVEIFRRAREQMQTWLGEEFDYVEVRDNYRSLPAIIDFTNHVFPRIMQTREDSPPWITRYSEFNAYRTGAAGNGRVEMVLLDDEDNNIEEEKQREAGVLAQRIKGLVGSFEITDKATQQPRYCRYSDMAILLRKRTHLRKYEEALRQHDIPFVAVKGIGFYQEPEVAMLRALLFFLSNPGDDYSLYVVLKSPLFNLDEGAVLQIISSEGDSLFEKLTDCSNRSSSSNGLSDLSGLSCLSESFKLIKDWLSRVPHTPISELLEHILVSTKAWTHFHDAQKKANIKKVIRIIEDLEASGKSLIRIRDFLERTFDRNEEPKANVNTEGMDAVRIMTIHAAKGLEFPVVFIPGLEEPFKAKTDDRLVFESSPISKAGRFVFKSIPDASIRKQDEDFLIHLAKEEEEHKRLFYVAVTRAEEALFLISRWSTYDKCFFGYLRQSLGIDRQGEVYTSGDGTEGLSLLTATDVKTLYERASKKEPPKTRRPRIEVIPLPEKAQAPWKAVTETADIRRRHGKDWLLLGDIMHRIFEGVSKGILQEQDVRTKAGKLLVSKGTGAGLIEEKIAIIETDVETLKAKGIWQDIIMPREDSFAELPFVLETGDVIYNGRIDRIIKEDNVYKIYDYKTFPVKEEEVGYLLKEYSFQMNIYRQAVRRLFNTHAVKSFIVFTHTGDVREV